MRIIIDICHPAHVNFFSPVVRLLKGNGHQVRITVLNRGKLPAIAKDMFHGCDLQVINRHRGTKWSIIIEANILKFFTLLRICIQFRPDIGLSAGSFILGAVMKILGKPNIQFDDDPERKMNVLLEKLTATRLFFPMFYNHTSHKVSTYNALKEWAYLSPGYFTPDPEGLARYELQSKTYIFVREVSVRTLNYAGQTGNIIATVADLLPAGVKVVLSLENKETASRYSKDWIILEEPVPDIHSLMYYSLLVISSGDSMAREGALLGVPGIYCGTRDMAANRVLMDKGMLLHLDIREVPVTVENILNGMTLFDEQETLRSNLAREWEDVPGFIYKTLSR